MLLRTFDASFRIPMFECHIQEVYISALMQNWQRGNVANMSTPIEDIIERAQNISEKMAAESDSQRDEYQRRHSTTYRGAKDSLGNKYLEVDGQFLPESLAMAKFTADHNYFLFFLIDTFWRLHRLVTVSLKDPLIQFSMRPLVELCYGKIMYFALREDTKQRDITVKYFLCTNGMLLKNEARDDKRSTEIYNHLIDELRREGDKNRFKKIRQKKYPLEDLADELRKIFPSVRIEHVASEFEPYLKGIWGDSFSKGYVGMLYSWMSQFMHGNMLLLRNMSAEKEDMSHSFKCTLILFLTGFHLLDFTHRKVLRNEIENPVLTEIKDEIRTLVEDFIKIRNLGRVSRPLKSQ